MLESGALAMSYFQKARIDIKEDNSLVTEADLAVEQLIRDHLERPEAGVFVIGEESINERSADYVHRAMVGNTFVVDPIDGTHNYANGLEMWGVSVGYMEEGRLKDGAIFMPVLGELFITFGDQVLFYKVCGGVLSEAQVLEKPMHKSPLKSILSVTQKVAKRGVVNSSVCVHAVGVAVYPICNLLRGRYTAYIGKLKLWDVAGGIPMMKRLGLEITLMNGTPIGCEVNATIYRVNPDEDRRFAMLDEVVFCHSGDFAQWREAIQR